MLSIDDIRPLLGDHTLSDEEVGVIRDTCHAIAESIVEVGKASEAQKWSTGSDDRGTPSDRTT